MARGCTRDRAWVRRLGHSHRPPALRRRCAPARGGAATACMLPDLLCAWLLLAMCASPRADHLLRTLPPDLSASYARGHDDAVWRCLLSLLGERTMRTPRSPPHAALQCCPRACAVWESCGSGLWRGDCFHRGETIPVRFQSRNISIRGLEEAFFASSQLELVAVPRLLDCRLGVFGRFILGLANGERELQPGWHIHSRWSLQ